MKVFRKLRQNLIIQSNFKKYLLYAIGEILLVMIGILLALQINTWNTQRLKNKAEIQTYANIKRQINDDKKIVYGNNEYNNNYQKRFEYAVDIIESNDRNRIDSLGSIAMALSKYSDVNINGNIYQALMNSGELKLLSNQRIIERLQRLEETYSYMNRMERIHFDVVMVSITNIQALIKFSDGSVQKPDKLYTYEFQNLFVSMISIMAEKNTIYQSIITEIETLTALIDQEIK